MKIFIFILTLTLLPISSKAGLVLQYSGGYTSYDNDNDEIQFSRMLNAFFLGASVGRKTRFLIGPSYTIWNQSHQNSDEVESLMAMTEFGATALIYLTKEQTWKVEASYCMSVNGKRKLGETEEILKGSAMRFGFGYHAPISENFAIGLNLAYQITNLTSSIIENDETIIDQTYTQMLPMLEIAYRY